METKEYKDSFRSELVREYVEEKCEEFNLMQTPCEHLFHARCLLTWMNVKMECPLCKSQLTPIV